MNGSAASGTGSAPSITVALHDSVDRLPAGCGALFECAPFQSSPGWWRCTVQTAMAPGARPLFALCADGDTPRALLPLQVLNNQLSALVTPYTTLFQPLIAADAAPEEVRRIGRALGHALAAWPSLRIDALDAAWPRLDPLLAGWRDSAWRGHRFDAFGNWHEPVAGRTYDAYMADRPGPLREIVRRKLRRHAGALTFSYASTPDEAAAAIAAYRIAHDRSWKQPEPFPEFDAAVTQQAAAAGVLRMAVLHRGDSILAAQYWTVGQGVATVLKLAHDQQASALSPGTLLTAMMIRRLLEQDGITDIDFGRGDDAYKQSWATQRRQRIGVVLARPANPRGLAVLAHSWLGALTRPIRKLRRPT